MRTRLPLPVVHLSTFTAMSKLLSLAVFLLILWVVLWVFLKITGLFLHLLWIAAIILAVMWLVGKLRGKSA